MKQTRLDAFLPRTTFDVPLPHEFAQEAARCFCIDHHIPPGFNWNAPENDALRHELCLAMRTAYYGSILLEETRS